MAQNLTLSYPKETSQQHIKQEENLCCITRSLSEILQLPQVPVVRRTPKQPLIEGLISVTGTLREVD